MSTIRRRRFCSPSTGRLRKTIELCGQQCRRFDSILLAKARPGTGVVILLTTNIHLQHRSASTRSWRLATVTAVNCCVNSSSSFAGQFVIGDNSLVRKRTSPNSTSAKNRIWVKISDRVRNMNKNFFCFDNPCYSGPWLWRTEL